MTMVVSGVCIDVARPAHPLPAAPALLFVHGAGRNSGDWHYWMTYFAARGWECAALNAFGRGGSADLPEAQLAARGILDLQEEVHIAVQHLGRPVILVAHSMGALPALAYAADHPDTVEGLCLLAPGIPREIADGEPRIDFDLDSLGLVEDTLWSLPAPEASAPRRDHPHAHFGVPSPESPRAVREMYEMSVSVPLDRIRVPSLTIAASHDMFKHNDLIEKLADEIGAEFQIARNHTHLLHVSRRRWIQIAEMLHHWLQDARWQIRTSAA